MEGFGWIMTVVLGGLAGWIAEKVMKFDTGLIMNIVLGIVHLLLAVAVIVLASIPAKKPALLVTPAVPPTASV